VRTDHCYPQPVVQETLETPLVEKHCLLPLDLFPWDDKPEQTFCAHEMDYNYA
jgi:hypothetical protein